MVTSRLANRVLYQYTNRFMSLSMQAGFFDYLNTAGTIGLVHLLISPYYLAFHHQHKRQGTDPRDSGAVAGDPVSACRGEDRPVYRHPG
jgi:hypothetical protein